jgi:hypothetical protein
MRYKERALIDLDEALPTDVDYPITNAMELLSFSGYREGTQGGFQGVVP